MESTIHHEEKSVEHALISGSSTEALTGAAGVVLAILGLANIAPNLMVAVAAIALGASLIFDGAAIAAEYSRILDRAGNGKLKTMEVGGGISTQVGGGITAVVLGVLALLHIDGTTLMAITAIVLGVTVMSSSGVTARLNALKIETSGDHDTAKRIAGEALRAATGSEVLVGLGAAVLGILALVGIAPMTLILVAMLAVGASLLLTGGAIIGKMLSMFAS